MQAISALYYKLLIGMAILSGVLIVTAVFLIVLDVMMRLFGLSPFLFVLTFVEYSMLWFTMLAAPYLVRIKGHVFIDAVTLMLPQRVRFYIAKVVYLLCIIASLISAYSVSVLLIEAIRFGDVDMRSFEVPMWILFASMPLSFGMCAIEFTRYLLGFDDMYNQSIAERGSV